MEYMALFFNIDNGWQVFVYGGMVVVLRIKDWEIDFFVMNYGDEGYFDFFQLNLQKRDLVQVLSFYLLSSDSFYQIIAAHSRPLRLQLTRNHSHKRFQ